MDYVPAIILVAAVVGVVAYLVKRHRDGSTGSGGGSKPGDHDNTSQH
jgi:hypothetical protein